MNNVSIQKALQDMQALANQAKAGGVQETQNTEQADFSSMLKQAVDNVNELQSQSSEMSAAFVRGENVPLTDVMVAAQKSRVAFEAMKETRRHLLEAYQQISRMQV
ncbi:flagellar hook-basal body complex protein FliE [Ectothiorhodospiraceae bacterium WFHF3C12]|nr:flagellar hook-basal body complex protein FliE [Ectothiorhodospiraceae bacterium WFHF3C12]